MKILPHEKRHVKLFLPNVERMHSYQRRRAWLAGLGLDVVESILAERLVGVVMSRFVRSLVIVVEHL